MSELESNLLQRFLQQCGPKTVSECIPWTGYLTDGYGAIRIPGCRGGTRYKAHRVAWEIFRGPIPHGSHVLHVCDNRCCVNPSHLFLGTNKDNIVDMMHKGRQSRGELHVKSKLTDESVLEIRRLHGTLTQVQLARIFKVSTTTIGCVVHRLTWKHI